MVPPAVATIQLASTFLVSSGTEGGVWGVARGRGGQGNTIHKEELFRVRSVCLQNCRLSLVYSRNF